MLYRYKALRGERLYKKKIEAKDEGEVIQYLKDNGYFPIEVKEVGTSQIAIFSSFFDRITFTDIVDLTRQLAIMLNAGLTIVDSLEILKKQTTKESLLKLIEEIDKHVKGGNTLSSALKSYPQYFSNLYIALVKSGEASGKLADILLKLSENLESEREFRGKLKGALIYPIIVVTAMIIVMFIMVTFVVPKLLGLYTDFQIDLPWTTKLLIAISSVTTRLWPVIIVGAIGAYIGMRSYFRTRAGKYMLDSTLLRLPILKNVVQMAALVNSTRTLSILVESGVSILEALNIVVETAGNSVYEESFKNIYKKVEKGQSIGESLASEKIFPPILVQMTIVGESTGHLDDTLGRLSRYFQSESELAIKAMTTLIEPLILVFLGLGVGFLVLSVITPIYNLTSHF